MKRPIPLALIVLCLTACSTEKRAGDDFYTSGSREADQRADQRISGVQQIRGEGEGTSGDAAINAKPSLYERLGGHDRIARIVGDFVDRVLADPRVNWTRRGVTRGGVLGVGKKSAAWEPTPEHIALLKDHIAQFIAVATGGPAKYDGRDMKQVHSGMKVSNAEFDAAVGDMKASLDALRVATAEQKELLSVLESTRPQIAEER